MKKYAINIIKKSHIKYFILLLFIIPSMSIYLFESNAFGADWKVIMNIDNETFYYDDESYDRTSSGIVSVWGRSQSGKKMQDNLKDLIEIDCNKREFRIAATVDLDKDIDGTQIPQQWSTIENNSPCEKLYRIFCAESKH